VLPPEITEQLKSELGFSIAQETSVTGGSINECARLSNGKINLFIKWNQREKYPGMLEAEDRGLTLLRKANAMSTPQTVLNGATEKFQFLVMEYISPGVQKNDYWERFGRELAALHTHSAGDFGLDHNNFMGSLPQDNSSAKSYHEFFIYRRLKPQIAMAKEKGFVTPKTESKLSALCEKLPSLIPESKPALVHGDLWSGNLICDSQGHPMLIDPAVHYAHPEVDLAMTQLFGGFDNRYLDAYNENAQLVPGWKERLPLFNLYPLLVHVNLFGKSYLSRVDSIIQRYV
jgi:protein-ribulosamine 3-kinase